MPAAEAYASTGERMNHLTRAALPPVASPVLDVNYPIAYAYDGLPGSPIRFGSLSVVNRVTQDLNMIVGGDMETWPLPTSTTGPGVVLWQSAHPSVPGAVVTQAAGDTGSWSAFVPAGVTLGADLIVRPGETVAVKARMGNAAQPISLSLYCLETGKYWTGSSWTSAVTAYASILSAAWTTQETDVVMESANTVKLPLLTLRVEVYSDLSGTGAYVDGLYAWPHTDFAAIVGSQYVDQAHTTVFRSSTDNFVANDSLRGTFTFAKPNMYVKFTKTGDRYIRWNVSQVLNKTPRGQIMFGELLATQVHSFSASKKPVNPYRSSWKFTRTRAQARFKATGGNVFPVPLAGYDREDVEIPFEFRSQTQFDTWYAELRMRSEGGTQPIVMVPNSGLPRCVFGLMDDRLAFDYTASSEDGTTGFYSAALRISELAPLDVAL